VVAAFRALAGNARIMLKRVHHVLVVDDDEAVAKHAVMQLRRHGHHPTRALSQEHDRRCRRLPRQAVQAR
jgi:CheY-like chemotaxis protein